MGGDCRCGLVSSVGDSRDDSSLHRGCHGGDDSIVHGTVDICCELGGSTSCLHGRGGDGSDGNGHDGSRGSGGEASRGSGDAGGSRIFCVYGVGRRGNGNGSWEVQGGGGGGGSILGVLPASVGADARPLVAVGLHLSVEEVAREPVVCFFSQLAAHAHAPVDKSTEEPHLHNKVILT